jgi:hypothetical protein
MSIPNVNKTRISVVTKPTNVSVSSVGIRGKAGETQDLTNYAILNGGNDFIGNQTISGSLNVDRLEVGDFGSVLETQLFIEAFITDYKLLDVVNSSTGTLDNLLIGTYGNINGVVAPWAVFQLGTGSSGIPISTIQIDDILSGTSIIPSTVVDRGSGEFDDYVIVNLDLAGLGQIQPVVGATFRLLRPLQKAGFDISTQADTDIFLNSRGNGDVIVNTNLLPIATNVNSLGTPTRRWKELYLGPGTLFVQDETLGSDIALGARDGNVYLQAAKGLTVGEFTFRDNKILLDNPSNEIIIGQQIASGSVVFNRPIQVNTFAGSGSFIVDKSGRTQLIVPNIPAGDIGAFSIVGNQSNKFQPVTSAGGMVHITGNDGQVNRFNMDAFGSGSTNSFNGIIARAARGTAASPSQSKAGDVILRLTSTGWRGDTGFGGTAIVGGATSTLDFVALEDQMNNARGSAQQFYNAPIGTRNRVLSAQIDTDGLIVPNIPTNNTATQILVWDSVSGRIGKQSGANNLDGGAAASVYLSVSEELNGGGA